MNWEDEGFITQDKPWGEKPHLITVFTREHGLWKGLVRQRSTPKLQVGMRVFVRWRSRLESQLGTWQIEPQIWPAFWGFLQQPICLLALLNCTSFLQYGVPERHPYPPLYTACLHMVDQLSTLPLWAWHYLQWELFFLEQMGYGLDLTQCAVTGQRQGLSHVSPLSGRAVSYPVARPYEKRLLPLPSCLIGLKDIPHSLPPKEQMAAAFRLTGHFLQQNLFHGCVPFSRTRLLKALLDRC